MDVLHELECDEKEASRVEGNYIRNNKCINRAIAGRSDEEYRKENKKIILEKVKIWKKNNTQKITCGCGAKVCRNGMWIHLKTKKHTDFMASQSS